MFSQVKVQPEYVHFNEEAENSQCNQNAVFNII